MDPLRHSSSSLLPQWQTRSMSWFTHALTEENRVSQFVTFPAPIVIYVLRDLPMTHVGYKGVPGYENRY